MTTPPTDWPAIRERLEALLATHDPKGPLRSTFSIEYPSVFVGRADLRAALSWADRVEGLELAYRGYVSSPAARDVLAERRRQIEVEGWTPEHDDEHSEGEMARAASCYADPTPSMMHPKSGPFRCPMRWPTSWGGEWWKPKDRRSNLVRAAALIVAEIERLDRTNV